MYVSILAAVSKKPVGLAVFKPEVPLPDVLPIYRNLFILFEKNEFSKIKFTSRLIDGAVDSIV